MARRRSQTSRSSSSSRTTSSTTRGRPRTIARIANDNPPTTRSRATRSDSRRGAVVDNPTPQTSSTTAPTINPQTLSVGARSRVNGVWYSVTERRRRVHGRMRRTRVWERDTIQPEPSILKGYKSSLPLTQRKRFLNQVIRAHGAGPVFNKLKQLAVYNSRRPSGTVMWNDVKWIGEQLPTLDCPPERPVFSRRSNRCIQRTNNNALAVNNNNNNNNTTTTNTATSLFSPQVRQNQNSIATTDLSLFGIKQLSQDRQIGQRPYQEDQWVEVFLERFFAAVVLDGHGGAKCALFMSSQLEPVLRSLFPTTLNTSEITATLKQVGIELQRRWTVYANSHGQDTSGTTMTGILRDRQHLEKLYVFNLGDSTTLVYRPPTSSSRTPAVLFETRPHDLSRARQTQLRRAATAVNGPVSPPIVIRRDNSGMTRLMGNGFMLNLSGALGNLYMPGISNVLLRELEVHEMTLPAATPTRILVMSDGISDDFNATALMRLNKNNAKDLVQHAIDQGQKGDNVAAILMDV